MMHCNAPDPNLFNRAPLYNAAIWIGTEYASRCDIVAPSIKYDTYIYLTHILNL